MHLVVVAALVRPGSVRLVQTNVGFITCCACIHSQDPQLDPELRVTPVRYLYKDLGVLLVTTSFQRPHTTSPIDTPFLTYSYKPFDDHGEHHDR